MKTIKIVDAKTKIVEYCGYIDDDVSDKQAARHGYQCALNVASRKGLYAAITNKDNITLYYRPCGNGWREACEDDCIYANDEIYKALRRRYKYGRANT
jgi:hypothetical protein